MLPSVLSKISIEEFQITDWASQIAELQARIVASQTRIAQINEDNAVADGLLQAAQDAKSKISDQEIIADLLAQLSQLFGSDNNPDDGNGNQPCPEPQPNDDGGCEVFSQPLNQTVEVVEAAIRAETTSPLITNISAASLATVSSAPQEPNVVDAIAVTPEVSTEASPEVPQPEPQSEPEQLASDFQKEVQTRGIQTICSSDGTPKFDLIWTRLSDRVATYSSPENPYNWEHGFVSYLGFATKEVAESWQQHLLKIGAATKCIIRKVNRFKVDTPTGVRIRWEMKCHGLTESQLQHLLTFDLTQPPVIEAKASESEDTISDLDLALIKFQSGDRIKVIEPGHPNKGEFGTVKRLVMADGVVATELDNKPIERLFPPSFIEPLKVEDLELVVTDAPAEVSNIPTTDWKAEAKELGISLDNISPGHYLAYHKYRKLGEVIEKHDAINSYYVNRNQRTMLVVGDGDGQKYGNPYECAIGLAKFLKAIVEPEVAKTDLNGSYSEPFPPG